MKLNITRIALGALFITAVLIAYLPEPEWCIEMTCISNFSCGVLLIIDGIMHIRTGKGVPPLLFGLFALWILTVFAVCMTSLTGLFRFNFSGSFFVLHVVDPLLFVMLYLISVDERGHNWKRILIMPLPVLIYGIFDYITGFIRGEFVYGFFDRADMAPWLMATIAVCTYAITLALSSLLFYANRGMRRISINAKERNNERA